MTSGKSNLPSFNSLADLKPKGQSKVYKRVKSKGKKKFREKSDNNVSVHAKHSTNTSALTSKLQPIELKARQALINNQLQDAKQLYDSLITLKKDANDKSTASAFSNRGVINARLGDIHSAIDDFKQATALDDTYTSAFSNLANAYLSIQHYNEAYTAINRALHLNPDDYTSNFNHIIILSKLKRYQDAINAIEDLFIRFKDQVNTADPSPFIDIKKQVCDWDGIEALEQKVAQLINTNQLTAKWALVHINNHSLDGEQQLKVLQQYSQQSFGHLTRQPLPAYSRSNKTNNSEANNETVYNETNQQTRKFRVAYVSADFYDHATTRLMAQLFEYHDHTQFEWYAISHSRNDNSAMRERVIEAFDYFVEVNDWTDAQVCGWMREQQIDIAIDLKGHTGGNRLGIFARGCAPVQMTYIGFPGSTGSAFMDYIIGDTWVTPLTSAGQFCETILQLPNCYQPNDRHRYLPPQAQLNLLDSQSHAEYQTWRKQQRLTEGLPEDAFVLCCFNNTYKLHPSGFAIWIRLLQKHPKSVLWLLADKPLTETNLRAHARSHGVDDARIYFAPRTEQQTYLRRYLLADLFVDTFAYNAHTTGSDALWIGLPIVTLAGNSFASRVGASLLDTVGLPELITYSNNDYEQKIDELISHPERLTQLSQHLRDVRETTPLFNAKQMAKELEAIYRRVV